MKTPPQLECLPPEYRAALEAYIEAKGKDWVQKLGSDYWNGTDDQFAKHGHTLRAMRNDLEWGPLLFEFLDE